MGKVDIVVGAQWGDEGKGKWVQRVAPDYAIVVRFQGGDNAGHTIYHHGQKIVLHHLPAAALSPQVTCVLSAGMVINPINLVAELSNLQQHVTFTPDRLWISAAAHVITPWHVQQDRQRERTQAQPLGTTGRGIGPAYSTRALRCGLRMADYVDRERRVEWLTQRQHETQFTASQREDRQEWEKFAQAADCLRSYVCAAEARVRQRINSGEAVLLEGAQGVLLDLDCGTYPYVTASSTLASAALSSVGIPVQACGKIYGIAKGYLTRVGNGPFPSELQGNDAARLRTRGVEFGATTQRARRVGWLDCVALRYAQQLNGFDGIVLNKLDILAGLPAVKLCVAYQHPELGRLLEFPCDYRILEKCGPVWEECAGWVELPRQGRMTLLPPAAQAYVQRIETLAQCQVLGVGTGSAAGDVLLR